MQSTWKLFSIAKTFYLKKGVTLLMTSILPSLTEMPLHWLCEWAYFNAQRLSFRKTTEEFSQTIVLGFVLLTRSIWNVKHLCSLKVTKILTSSSLYNKIIITSENKITHKNFQKEAVYFYAFRCKTFIL